VFYDPDRLTDSYRRRLPHWQQGDVISFVTFRLADSIPAKALSDWDAERRIWLLHRLPSAEGELQNHLSQLAEEDRREYLRRFGKRFHDLPDAGHGSCLLRGPQYAKMVEGAMRHFEGECYGLGDYVIMPNHVHVLLLPSEAHAVSSIVGSWKKFSARQINQVMGNKGAIWQSESFDHLVRSAGSLGGFRRYIRENPAKANLREGEYRLGCGTME